MQTEKVNPFEDGVSNRKVIFFNGPPRCGKSTGAVYVANFVRNNSHMKPEIFDFAEPLKKAAHALFCVFHGHTYYDSREGAHLKGLSSGDFFGLSPREAYIALSEDFLKPKFGPDILGYILKKRMCRSKWSQVAIVPNCGFVEELKPIVDLVGQRNILIIEVHSAGKTYAEDSRGYVGDIVKEKWPFITVTKLPNVFGGKEDRDFYKLLCEGTVKRFLKIEEKV